MNTPLGASENEVLPWHAGTNTPGTVADVSLTKMSMPDPGMVSEIEARLQEHAFATHNHKELAALDGSALSGTAGCGSLTTVP